MTDRRHRPLILLVLFTVLAFGLLFILPSDFKRTYDIKVIAYCAILCFLYIGTYIIIRKFNMGDTYLYLIASMLSTIGVIMILRLDYSGFGEYVLSDGNGGYIPSNNGFSQMIFIVVGHVVFFVSYFAYRYIKNLEKLTWLYLAAILLFNILLFVPGIGVSVNGARNWLRIGGFSLQVSEIVKVIFVFAIASLIIINPKRSAVLSMKSFSRRSKDVLITSIVYVCLAFFVLENEWGTAVLIFLTYFTVMFLYGKNTKMIIANTIFATTVLVIGCIFVDHIGVRIEAWLNPKKSSNVMGALTAIAEGGFFGTGIGNGFPQYVFAAHTDFVFASICEEMGVFMGIAIILLYFIFSYRGIKIAFSTKVKFDKAVALLFTIMFAYQTFIIVGGVIKLIPLTGITLPFISSGGTSLMISYMMIGIITSISCSKSKRDKKKTIKE